MHRGDQGSNELQFDALGATALGRLGESLLVQIIGDDSIAQTVLIGESRTPILDPREGWEGARSAPKAACGLGPEPRGGAPDSLVSAERSGQSMERLTLEPAVSVVVRRSAERGR